MYMSGEYMTNLREPTELQVSVAIDAAERESAAWKIEKQPNGTWRVSDVGRMLRPGAMPVPLTSRDYDDVENARLLVKYHVWRAGVKAAINA